MKAITIAYELPVFSPEKVMKGELNTVILKGAYIFPVYAINEDIVELTDSKHAFAGYIAIASLTIKPKDELTPEEIKEAGWLEDDFRTYAKDELLVTLLHVIPIINTCENACACEECDGACTECHNCNGACACKEQ